MRLGSVLDDGEAEAGAAGPAGAVGLEEALENARQVLRLDARPGVLTAISTPPARGRTATWTAPPSGVNLIALLTG